MTDSLAVSTRLRSLTLRAVVTYVQAFLAFLIANGFADGMDLAVLEMALWAGVGPVLSVAYNGVTDLGRMLEGYDAGKDF